MECASEVVRAEQKKSTFWKNEIPFICGKEALSTPRKWKKIRSCIFLKKKTPWIPRLCRLVTTRSPSSVQNNIPHVLPFPRCRDRCIGGKRFIYSNKQLGLKNWTKMPEFFPLTQLREEDEGWCSQEAKFPIPPFSFTLWRKMLGGPKEERGIRKVFSSLSFPRFFRNSSS